MSLCPRGANPRGTWVDFVAVVEELQDSQLVLGSDKENRAWCTGHSQGGSNPLPSERTCMNESAHYQSDPCTTYLPKILPKLIQNLFTFLKQNSNMYLLQL